MLHAIYIACGFVFGLALGAELAAAADWVHNKINRLTRKPLTEEQLKEIA